MRFILFFYLVLGFFTTYSQNWHSLGPNKLREGHSIYSNDSNLFVHGIIRNYGWSTNYCYIMRYNGTSWDSSSYFGGQVRSMTSYKGNLVAGGGFNTVNGQVANGVAINKNGVWQPLGYLGLVYKVKVVNDTLFALGSFDTINGMDLNGVAWFSESDSSWQPFADFPFQNALVTDIANYNNEWYVGGNFGSSWGTQDLAVLKSGSWLQVGDGLSGSFTGINVLLVAHDQLYVGGIIYESDGNPGNGLIRWDGSQWKKLGSGLEGISPQVHNVFLKEDILYVAGVFTLAGGIPATAISAWDGYRWCSFLPLNLSTATGVTVFKDTLYGFGHFDIPGDTVRWFAKWTDGLIPDNCTGDLSSTLEIENEPFELKVSPNPANTSITISGSKVSCNRLSIVDISGREVGNYSSFQFPISIDVSKLEPGFYFVQPEDISIQAVPFIKTKH